MADLFFYLKQAQRFLHDARQEVLNPENLIEYINKGRREVAQRAQCVRRITPVSGACTTASVVAGGSGYTNPTVTITAPDYPSGAPTNPNGVQATALATTNNGAISAVYIQKGGDGYFQPQATITDPTGSGASVTVQTSPINVLNPGQEQYPFSSINVSMFPGVESVFYIRSVAVIYANYRYVLPMYSFSMYQAYIRQYPFQYQYVPTFCSQFGQGADGSFFAYPLPSQTYQWEFDCLCNPQDLIDNQSYDVIPSPWDDTVAYWAAHLAYLDLQNWNAAEYYFNKFDAMCLRKSNYARVGRIPNIYGRV
jgi:hypothetical protein